jgi:hypothetical protein
MGSFPFYAVFTKKDSSMMINPDAAGRGMWAGGLIARSDLTAGCGEGAALL